MQRGKRELQEGLSWGNGAPNKQNKRRRKTGKEKGGGSTNDAGVTYKVAVPKLSTVPVQRSSEHRKGMLPQLRAGGWPGWRDKAQSLRGPLLLQSSPSQLRTKHPSGHSAMV